MTTAREARTANRRLAQWRVTWLIEHCTSHQLLCWVDSFVLRNPPLRQAPKRYKQPITKNYDGQKQPSTKKANARNRTFWHFCIFPTARGNRTTYKRAKIHQPHTNPKAC